MHIKFYKYQGAGNDFIIIDNREKLIKTKKKLAIQFCNRKFGIGSDGLIFIEDSESALFKMDFLNPDGSRSFCGNGSRCAVKFVFDLQKSQTKEIVFEAIDGNHNARLQNEKIIAIKMHDVRDIKKIGNDYFTDTGSPHYVSIFDSIDNLNMISYGHKIRYSNTYKTSGTNVNAVEIIKDSHIKVRTYERGVENETLACGTGVTACALSYGLLKNLSEGNINIDALGGKLTVSFLKKDDKTFTNIWLEGPAHFVYKGEINV